MPCYGTSSVVGGDKAIVIFTLSQLPNIIWSPDTNTEEKHDFLLLQNVTYSPSSFTDTSKYYCLFTQSNIF